jgi:hypothetical protein
MHWKLTARVVGVILLTLSVGVNVLQAHKIRAMTGSASVRGPLIGSKARPFEGRTPDGRAIEVAFDARVPTVLYYFSTRCGWCDRNWTNIEALATGANGRFRVVAVTAQDGIKEYVKGRDPRVEFIEAIDDEALRAYRFTLTPHTVVIDGSGLVTHEWKGAFMNRIATQIEDLFDVMLPGLSAPAGRPGPE